MKDEISTKKKQALEQLELPTSKPDILAGLNEEQHKAVTHKDGPLLIIAGAGTGKTNVITKRIAWLIEQKLARPEEILALTFTDKAATEMEQRVFELVPYGMVNIWISTFHGFGDRILRNNAIELGITSDYELLTKPEQILMFKDNIFDLGLKHFLPLGNPGKHIEAILDFFSRVKDEDVTEKELTKFAKAKEDPKLVELAEAFIKYNDIIHAEGKLDFGDLISLCIKLFRSNPDVLKFYQKQFKYILMDEFQDTNYAQYQLVKLLVKENSNITVVADDDQSIYRFRGAAISNVLQFQRDYPKSEMVILTKNYRSTQEILDSSYKLIQHNNPDRLEAKNNISKRLTATRNGQSPIVMTFENGSAEADTIAEIIKQYIDEGKYQYKDFAILVRANSQAAQFMQALDFEQIPYHFTGRTGLYNRPEIRLVINFLKAITNDDDSVSLFHLATSHIFKLKPSEVIPFMSYARRRNQSLKQAFRDTVNRKVFTDIHESTYSKIKKLHEDLIRYQNLIGEYTTGQIVYSFLNESGYLKQLLNVESPESELRILNISHFFETVIKKFEFASLYDKSALKFIENLELLMGAGENPSTAQMDMNDNVVKVLTVHMAKGLEFPVVFMVNLTSDRFPSRNRSEAIPLPEDLIKETLPGGDFHLQEERRLFYVGMTRAKDMLYLTWAKKYHDNIKEKKPSQFLLEAIDMPRVPQILQGRKPSESIERYSKVDLPANALDKFKEGNKLILTPHQIEDYLTCPLRFKYVHIMEIPDTIHPRAIYGTAIHKAIEFMLKGKIKGKLPEFNDICKVFTKNWTSEGFITREHEDRMLEEGKKALERFYQEELSNDKVPIAVEKRFQFALDDNLLIDGRIDTIYKTEEGIEIKDFKTSSVADEDGAEAAAKRNRPLAIYALAMQRMKGINPKLTLHFVDLGVEGSIVKTEKDIDKLIDEIDRVRKGILAKEFPAKPVYRACPNCPYQDICPHTQVD